MESSPRNACPVPGTWRARARPGRWRYRSRPPGRRAPTRQCERAQDRRSRRVEAADLHGNAADLGGELFALPLTHERGVDAARELANARQPGDPRAMLDLLRDVAREPVDPFRRAIGVA